GRALDRHGGPGAEVPAVPSVRASRERRLTRAPRARDAPRSRTPYFRCVIGCELEEQPPCRIVGPRNLGLFGVCVLSRRREGDAPLAEMRGIFSRSEHQAAAVLRLIPARIVDVDRTV